jgi:hypothetical protein
MSNPIDDALQSLQAPQQQQAPNSDMLARNAAIINQFNHSNAHERARKNAERMAPPNYDALMQKLGSIDALQMRRAPVDSGRFNPAVLKLANTAYKVGNPDLAGNILEEEEKKIRARDAIGGAPLSTMAWDKLRDNAGQQAVRRHADPADNTGPLGEAMAKPGANDDLYRIGVDSFDRLYGKHKKYLVEDNLSPTGMAPPAQPQSPRLSPPPAAPAVESAPVAQNAQPMNFTGASPDPGASIGTPRMPLPLPPGTRTVGDSQP